ncbi:hypothetical protein V1264_016791 [Littorina saxatilis]|uniref:Uncharacterized protein n=1 Tax=Littorina saxatilis TaxID=31220 RepID=A0AAN9BHP1_9CAEN
MKGLPFTANTSTVPYLKGYNATLTFTISNQCPGKGSWVKKIKVFTETEVSVATPSCQILFVNETTPLAVDGCTYDPKTQYGTFTKTIVGYQDVKWSLVGKLKSRKTFNTTVYIRPQCAFFTANTNIAQDYNGYRANLSFTFNNTCQDVGSYVKSVKVLTNPLPESHLVPSCQIFFFTEPTRALETGCTYDHQTGITTYTRHIDGYQSEKWILVGELGNGRKVKKTVEISPNGSIALAGQSVVLIMAASIGTVTIVVILIVIVCGVRRKARGAAQDEPNGQSTGNTYLHAISPPAEQSRSPPARDAVQTQSLRTHTAEDDYGYTIPDGPHHAISRNIAINEPRETVSNRISTKSSCEDTGASTTMPITEARGYKPDDDGYACGF